MYMYSQVGKGQGNMSSLLVFRTSENPFFARFFRVPYLLLCLLRDSSRRRAHKKSVETPLRAQQLPGKPKLEALSQTKNSFLL